MNVALREQLRQELLARGFDVTGEAPHRTMALADGYLHDVELADLLETLVARREKVFGSVAVVGQEAAKRSYDDVVLAIDAVKAVLEGLTRA